MRTCSYCVILLLTGAHCLAAPLPPSRPVLFQIQAPSSISSPVNGRILIFLKQGRGDTEVNVDEFHPSHTYVAARDVRDLAPGTLIEVDADAIAFPHGFSTLSTGDYEVQAVLDTERSYDYFGRTPQDWISPVLTLPHWTPGVGEPRLILDTHPVVPAQATQAATEQLARVVPGVAEKIEFSSVALSRFWGRDIKIRAWVILPPDYAKDPRGHFPTVYWTHGFGGSFARILGSGLRLRERMNQGKTPPMIWVMLDESIPQGTHEFADSVNNGPWGTALTEEFIPYLESHYRMDAKSSGRLLNGHSSGGWATLQLQINYPEKFGGTWSTSPDASDFHDFNGVNLYAPDANLYRKPDGSPYPIMRVDGQVLATFQEFSQLEFVLGSYGGQMTSFDWVFSPKGDSGAPLPMFDRATGDIDPSVVAYWRAHYDLSYLVETRWPQLRASLTGKIHLIVGTADTFYLDGSAHLFEQRLTALGAEPHVEFLAGKTHFDLYAIGEDNGALYDRIAAQMYRVARPGTPWTPAPVAPAAN